MENDILYWWAAVVVFLPALFGVGAVVYVLWLIASALLESRRTEKEIEALLGDRDE